MTLYPPSFIDDLKHQADIVVVIQDYVSLKKTGATYKGLCPFHGEKTPSFHVNRDRGFFHCFGCGVGGDVIKFLELHEKVGFQDAVRQLAQRFGMSMPEPEQTDEQRASAADREALLKVHEVAAKWFRDQLLSPAGAHIRRQIEERGITDVTSEAMGLGFAPAGRTALKDTLVKQGFSEGLLVRAGLLVQREGGPSIDRFRNRLMIPIRRDTGSVIAFGGRPRSTPRGARFTGWISPSQPYVKKASGLSSRAISISARLFRPVIPSSRRAERPSRSSRCSNCTDLRPRSFSVSTPMPRGRGRRPSRASCLSPRGST